MKIRIAVLSAAGALALMSNGANAAIDDKTATALMNKAGCAACHSVDKKGVGPSYKDVSKKRKGQKDVAATLEKKVREGGAGVYSPVPMPPNPKEKISDADIKHMVEWILTK